MNRVNLPILESLKSNESTYITFSKALLDLDKSVSLKSEYYFSKMVAIKLPDWSETEFYLNPDISLSSVGVATTNPNTALPRYIARYMENIIRQEISDPRVTEIAFWKMLQILHRKSITIDQLIRDSVKVINKVVTSDFYELKNNNGWGKVITQIPNNPDTVHFGILNPTIPRIQSNDADDEGLYDNGDKQFDFADCSVIDFDTVRYSSNDGHTEPVEFNAILLFYKDSDGIEKLHGINFITPYINKATSWILNPLTIGNSSIGYQFIFNIKTCNNEASITKILENNEHVNWWNGFEQTFDKLNTLIDLKIRESKYINRL